MRRSRPDERAREFFRRPGRSANECFSSPEVFVATLWEFFDAEMSHDLKATFHTAVADAKQRADPADFLEWVGLASRILEFAADATWRRWWLFEEDVVADGVYDIAFDEFRAEVTEKRMVDEIVEEATRRAREPELVSRALRNYVYEVLSEHLSEGFQEVYAATLANGGTTQEAEVGGRAMVVARWERCFAPLVVGSVYAEELQAVRAQMSQPDGWLDELIQEFIDNEADAQMVVEDPVVVEDQTGAAAS